MEGSEPQSREAQSGGEPSPEVCRDPITTSIFLSISWTMSLSTVTSCRSTSISASPSTSFARCVSIGDLAVTFLSALPFRMRVIHGSSLLCKFYFLRRRVCVKDGLFLERIELPYTILRNRPSHVSYHRVRSRRDRRSLHPDKFRRS